MLAAFNAIVTRAIDALMRPAADLPPLVSLAVLALLSAAAILLVAKWTSNQRAIADAKRQIQADLFEVRLFNDDLAGTFRALGAMLRHTLTYCRHSLIPALWLVVPFTLAAIHLEAFYGVTGIAPGTTTLLTATFDPDGAAPDITLESSPGVRIDAPAVWFPASHEMVWRIAGVVPGPWPLRFRVGGESVTKTLEVSTRLVRRSPARVSGSLVDELLAPSEAPLPPGSLRALAVDYPEASLEVADRGLPWLVVYLALTLLFAWVLRRPMGVEM